MRPKPELKAECIRLREEERLSLKAIAAKTGASVGSLSMWLRPYPLTLDERSKAMVAGRIKAGDTRRKRRLAVIEVPWHPSWLVKDERSLSGQVKARIAEAAVLFRLALLGGVPLAPVFDGERVDWYVQFPGSKIMKIQVKWAGKVPDCGGKRIATARSNHALYTKGDLDFLVAYDLESDSCFVWSFSEIQNSTTKGLTADAREAWHKLHAGIA